MLYLIVEEFLFGFVIVMKECDIIKFKEMIWNVDYLLIDDVYFIVGKLKIEDEFLYMIVVLIVENK